MAHLPRRSLLIALSLATAGAIAACATKPDDDPPRALLPAGSFLKTYDAASAGGNFWPFSANDDLRHQMLYLAGEVGGSGWIDSIWFKLAQTVQPAVTCVGWTIRFGHTALGAFPSPAPQSFAGNVNRSSLAPALEGANITIPPGVVGDWWKIPLAKPFHYNGVENLVVEIETLGTCTQSISMSALSTFPGRRAASHGANTSPTTAEHSLTTTTFSDATQHLMKFGFVGGEDQVRSDAIAGGNNYPLSSRAGGVRWQNLYLASDVAGSGPITGVALEADVVTTNATYTYSMRMGHTDATVLTTTLDSNASGWVTLASNLTFSVPQGMPVGSRIWIPIPSGAFTYDGVRNLVLEITATGTVDTRNAVSARTGARAYAHSGTPGAVDSTLSRMTFRFAGAPVVWTDPGTSGHPEGFSSASQSQTLLAGARTGAGGALTRVSVRMGAPTGGTTIPGFEIHVGQTDKTAFVLGDSYASNMDGGGVLTFQGTVTVPAGLAAGDWLDIPLASAFQYDGRKNLVVHLRPTGTATGTDRIMYRLNSPVPATLAFGAVATPLTGTPDVIIANEPSLRLFFER